MLLVAVTTKARSEIESRKLGGPPADPPQAGRQDRLQCLMKTAAVQENDTREGPGCGVRVLRECASATARL